MFSSMLRLHIKGSRKQRQKQRNIELHTFGFYALTGAIGQAKEQYKNLPV